MRRRALILVFLAAPAVLVLVVLLINLRGFDEPLLPELEALRTPRPLMLDGNAFPYALGFLAAEDRDPREAGVEIIEVLQARRERGEPATISQEEKQDILGEALTTEGLGAIARPITEPSAATTSLGKKCLPRYRLDCAQELIATVAALDWSQPPFATLFARHENLLRQAHYVEVPAPDPLTPWPPLGVIQEVGRVRLAISYRTESTAEFLKKVSQELRFWRMTLREGQLLGTKMSALAGIRWAHDFIATLLRERELDARELEQLRDVVRPFTLEESDIGDAFLSESRTALLGGQPSVTADAPWWTRLLTQTNATFNQEYRETIAPMRERASLDASEFWALKAHEPLRHEFRWTPAMFYNLGGKLALSQSTWDVHFFPARVHDEQGRITLLLLAAQLEEQPHVDLATRIRTSSLRNPYTGDPMEYDAAAGTIGFDCLHTAHHPPEPADRCLVALGRPAP